MKTLSFGTWEFYYYYYLTQCSSSFKEIRDFESSCGFLQKARAVNFRHHKTETRSLLYDESYHPFELKFRI